MLVSQGGALLGSESISHAFSSDLCCSRVHRCKRDLVRCSYRLRRRESFPGRWVRR